MLKLHKFAIVTVLLEEEDGEVIAERTTEPAHVFGIAGLRRFTESVEDEIAKLNERADD